VGTLRGRSGHPLRRTPELDPLWLVDPLDGTREFLKRNGNLRSMSHDPRGSADCRRGRRTAQDRLYWGEAGKGSWLADRAARHNRLQSAQLTGARLDVVQSRSIRLRKRRVPGEDQGGGGVEVGSALKVLHVAEGGPTLPATWPTMEWDTAAGQAVVGGSRRPVMTLDGASMPTTRKTCSIPTSWCRASSDPAVAGPTASSWQCGKRRWIGQ